MLHTILPMKKKRHKKQVNQASEQLAGYKAFCNRLRLLCEKMVGPGYFEMFSNQILAMLYKQRYPPLKLQLDDGVIGSEADRAYYKERFSKFLKEFTLELPSGNRIPFYTLFSDVTLLVHFVEYASSRYVKGYERMRKAFEPYFVAGGWMIDAKYKVLSTLSFLNESLYDFNKGVVQFDADESALSKAGGTNEIRLCRLKPTFAIQEVDGVKRTIAALGDAPLTKGDWNSWITLTPDQLGITDMEDTQPKPLYIQQHALLRYAERSYAPPGTMPRVIVLCLLSGQQKTVMLKGRLLMECNFVGHKIGYFVLTFHGDKWLVRTFLFLTNEGTPEGARLKALVGVEKEDKKYLEIDQMGAFLKYDIEHNPRLVQLFEAAGCGSLFAYAKFYDRTGHNIKSGERIADYLFK